MSTNCKSYSLWTCFSLHDQIWIENNLFHYNQASTAFVKCAKKEGGYGPRVFLCEITYIRVEKIKVFFGTQYLRGLFRCDIGSVTKKESWHGPVNKWFGLRKCLSVFSPIQISLHLVLGNGLEAHHEKGLPDVIKSQHFFWCD